ncbi:9295_t:CDS:1, partial [Racocetra persica]
MSKSRGNVINPNELVEKYGADALRLYEVFVGPIDQTANFNTDG